MMWNLLSAERYASSALQRAKFTTDSLEARSECSKFVNCQPCQYVAGQFRAGPHKFPNNGAAEIGPVDAADSLIFGVE